MTPREVDENHGGDSLSSLPAEPDCGPLADGQSLGGVSIDDCDLDRSPTAEEGDEGPAGTLAVSADEPFDPRPRHLDGPTAWGPGAQAIAEEVRDQVAEGIAEEDFADQPLRMFGRLEAAQG